MGTPEHTLLIAALTLSVVFMVQRILTWRKVDPLPKEVTFGFATALAFGLYLLDWQFPWLFQDRVVSAFASSLSIPGVMGVLDDLAKKANPEVTRAEAIVLGEPISPPEESKPAA